MSRGAYGLKESEKLEMGLAFDRDDLKAKLDLAIGSGPGASKASGSIAINWGNHRAGANFSAVIGDPKLLEVGAFYGFKDPNEFKSFLVEYKHKASISEHQLSLMVEETLSDVRLRWQQKLTWGGERGGQLESKFHGAKFLNKDAALLAGVEHQYDFKTRQERLHAPGGRAVQGTAGPCGLRHGEEGREDRDHDPVLTVRRRRRPAPTASRPRSSALEASRQPPPRRL